MRARIERYIRGVRASFGSTAATLSETVLLSVGAGFIALTLFFLVTLPPFDFKAGNVTITQGESATDIASALSKAGVIRSQLVFRVFLRLAGSDARVQAGTYKFSRPESVTSIERRLLVGDYGIPFVRLTFVEGFTVREAAEQVAAALPISEQEFLDAATPYEGYLFPDTYMIQVSSTAGDVVKKMRDAFTSRVAKLDQSGKASGHTISDIVIMASIIEREARSDESRKIVSGILWNRIERNMPLQVDAVFGYIFDRATYSPTLKDLKVNSPYNTYTHKGLPPGPISNPGISALTAAANPADTPYLYYLTGRDGRMHYATNYLAHKANLYAYLR